MGEGQLGADVDRPEADLDPRLLAMLLGLSAIGPGPAHHDLLGPNDLDICASAFAFVTIEHAEADPEGATDPDIGLGD